MTTKVFGQAAGQSEAPGGPGVWIDLTTPDQREIDDAHRLSGLHIPSREELEEIETSSRTYVANGAIYVSLPMIARLGPERFISTPVGFVLSKSALITVRFDDLPWMEQVQTSLGEMTSPAHVLVRLVDAVVDRLADVSEHVEESLGKISARIFSRGEQSNRPTHATIDMRAVLRHIGGLGNLISILRGALLGLTRMIPFLLSQAKDLLGSECLDRLTTARHDVESLVEFETHLSDKMQFLLDATLGFINISQNETFRILTIVSVIGIPPTILVGVWGMNFKHMPELDWTYGYPFGLALTALSALIPAIWLKWRGWL